MLDSNDDRYIWSSKKNSDTLFAARFWMFVWPFLECYALKDQVLFDDLQKKNTNTDHALKPKYILCI